MGSFEMHMRGGPFVAPDKPVFAIDKKKLIVPLEDDLSAGKCLQNNIKLYSSLF